jgi:hypothetical protein
MSQSRKIVRMSYWLILVLVVCLCPLALVAQESATQEQQEKKADQKPARHLETVTGCLQKGDEPGEFSIIGEDGKTWGLRSTSVKLDKHLGHTVTVAGSRTHESKAQEKAEEKKEGQVEKASSKEEYADLSVASLKMVSETCNK